MSQTLGDCWYLTGPTASGKTGVGIELAEAIGAEILSLDSMAIYRGMDIGTAKPGLAERARIPHHLLDLVGPHETFSVARYLELAEAKVAEIRNRGREVLFVGGTPLYLKSLLRGLFQGPPADWRFRRQVEEELAEVGQEALHRRLAQVDPLSAHKLHPHDTRRMIRALEVYTLTGKPISHLQMQFEEGRPPDECKVFVLAREKDDLEKRIGQRVEWMFSAGLVEETRRLASDQGLGPTAQQAVGYREVLRHLAGQWDLAETISQVKTRTRRFAKRQRTWFRSLSECRPILVHEEESPAATAERILKIARS